MSVTLLTARTAIRERLEEPTAAQWTDAELNRWINEANRVVSRRAETIEIEWVSSAIVAGTQDKLGPTDALRIHRLAWHPTGDSTVYKLEPRALHALDAIGMTQLHISQQVPQFFAAWQRPGMTIRLYPTPGTDGVLKGVYYRASTDALTDVTTLDGIPEGWHDILYDYVEWKALRRANNPKSVDAQQSFEQQLDDLIQHTRHWHDQPLDIVGAEGGRGWASYPSMDPWDY